MVIYWHATTYSYYAIELFHQEWKTIICIDLLQSKSFNCSSMMLLHAEIKTAIFFPWTNCLNCSQYSVLLNFDFSPKTVLTIKAVTLELFSAPRSQTPGNWQYIQLYSSLSCFMELLGSWGSLWMQHQSRCVYTHLTEKSPWKSFQRLSMNENVKIQQIIALKKHFTCPDTHKLKERGLNSEEHGFSLVSLYTSKLSNVIWWNKYSIPKSPTGKLHKSHVKFQL